MPSWMKILGSSETALAASCSTGAAGSSFVPFVTLNLAGGAAMASNYVPMDAAGNPLSSYSKMGLGDGQVPLEKEFGNVPFAGMMNGALLSKMLEGLRSAATATTLSRTAFVSFCVRSRDDTAENKFDISGLIAKAGLVGSRLPNMGVSSTSTGINQMASGSILPPTPLIVRNFRDITTSLGYSAALGSQLSTDQKNKLAKLIGSLNASQARGLASSDKARDLVECAGLSAQSVVEQGAAGVDPAGNAAVARLWGISANNNTNSENYIFSSLIYNSLMGQAGAVSLQKRRL